MCGLIGYISKNKDADPEVAKEYIVTQFEDQKNRGMNGFGVSMIHEDGTVKTFRATESTKMFFDLHINAARHILMHHRMPTSSDNLVSQTHPILVENGELAHNWLVAHNGVISNDDLLKEKHEKMGYLYTTEYRDKNSIVKFNDSESLAIELARFLEGKSPEMECEGSFTFWAIAMTKEDQKVATVYLGSNSYLNMKMFENDIGFRFASEERTGEAVGGDKIVALEAAYGPDNKLVTFNKVPDMIQMKYPIPSPYAGSGYNWSGYNNSNPSPKGRMGFHGTDDEKDTATVVTSVAKVNVETNHGGRSTPVVASKATSFTSFGHIINYLVSNSISDVFFKNRNNHAVSEFPLTVFNAAITAGDISKAEDLLDTYTGDEMMADTYAEAFEDALTPVTIDVSEDPTNDEMADAQKMITRRRMAIIAKAYLPIFQVVSYAELAILFAYERKRELDDKKISAQIDQADPDKLLDEQMDKDIEEVFPSKKVDAVSDAEKRAKEIADDVRKKVEDRQKQLQEELNDEDVMTPSQALEGDAITMLETLSHTAHDMEPDTVLTEAEDVGSVLRTAAELAITDYLRQIETVATEDGMPLRIPFYFNQIKDQLTKVESRFSTLAHIVKAAKTETEAWNDHQGSLLP